MTPKGTSIGTRRYRYIVLPAAVAAAIAGGTTLLTGISFWIGFGIALIAILINGLVATIEDRSRAGRQRRLDSTRDLGAPRHRLSLQQAPLRTGAETRGRA